MRVVKLYEFYLTHKAKTSPPLMSILIVGGYTQCFLSSQRTKACCSEDVVLPIVLVAVYWFFFMILWWVFSLGLEVGCEKGCGCFT